MSNFNDHRFRSQHQNDQHAWRTPQNQQNSNWNPHVRNEQNNEIDQQSPLPLLVPSFLPNASTPQGSHKYPLNQPLEKHLSYRTWSNTTYREYFRRNHQNHFKFSVVCYNILSQSLLEDNVYLYGTCSEKNLKWYRRRDRLFREILRQDADILCLQEMQNNHYENEFRPTLAQQGYDSIYLKRNGYKPDGCCLFYRRNRLKLVDSKLVSFFRNNIPVLNRDNCGLIALFQPLNSNATEEDLFCVATTHLLFSPKRGDIKLAQLQYFLAEIDQLALKKEQSNSYYPIVLCGDFNAQPACPLVNFVLSGHIEYNNYTSLEISGQTPDSPTAGRVSYALSSEALLPSSFVTSDCRLSSAEHRSLSNNATSTAVLTHDKNFASVYDSNDYSSVTSNVADHPKTVDYIFYTEQEDDPYRLNLLSRFDLYKDYQMLDVHVPNHQFPSDHFLLGAQFALKFKK
ncbi:hypothetical protein I4U23_023886 [Adineta vaga]|nr:hypothetical protein I4U23_023886 [Adineta vaga]